MPQYSDAARNNQLDTLETTLGTAAKLRVYGGAVPANVAAAAGTHLVEYTLASDWAAAATAAAKALTGTPLSATASTAGTATYYRFLTSANVAHVQGTAGQSGGGAELTFDNATFTVGQEVRVTGFSFTIAGG